MGDKDEARFAAMVEFLGTFPSLSSHPTDLTDLNDGVALFEALGEIAPTHFDPTTIARHLGDNWALKSSNLRKLVRNLEHYYHEVLGKTADFSSVAISDISRNSDREAIALLFELVAAAAVTCENRAEFVGRIMNMTVENQNQMKSVIESSMERLEDYDGYEHGAADGGSDEDDEKELVFGEYSGPTDDSGLFGSGASSSEELTDALRERDQLRRELSDSRRELASYKSERTLGAEEVEGDNEKLRELTADLQERLEMAQSALAASQETSTKSKRQLEEAAAAAEELREKNALLADELDVANAKANQLRKVEATAVAYRKKLESVGVMSQQMQELEDQSAGYLRQIIDLETANKQIPSLQKRIETMQDQMAKLEVQANESSEALKEKQAEVARVKTDLNAALNAKRMYEDELSDLRAQHENGGLGDDDIGAAMTGLSLTSSQSVKESREKIIRLEHENERLKGQLASAAGGGGASIDGSSEVEKLREEIKEKDAEIARISEARGKLEGYTKKTLAKFQQKYMAALQDCKAKLKEKHDTIEQLEMEKEELKATHKQEAQMMSSTLYELGLGIMQKNLTQR